MWYNVPYQTGLMMGRWDLSKAQGWPVGISEPETIALDGAWTSVGNGESSQLGGRFEGSLAMKRPTISDVAARAGVAKSTVSHTLSGKRPISEETRQRIQQAIDELGYRPDPVAQRLAGGRSRTIGFAYPLYESQIAALGMEFITSASRIINEAQYAFLLLTHLRDTAANLEHFVQSGLVDGFILMQIQLQDPRVEMLRRSGLPFVMVGRREENRGLAYVDVDVESAMAQCVALLAEQGHRALAYLHQHDPGLGFLERSLRGFAAACRQYGLAHQTLICEDRAGGGEAATDALLDQHPETTGVIAWSGKAAWGAAQAVRARDLRVPEDISIACFRDPAIDSLLLCESITIDIRPEELATRAARMLLALVEGEALSETQVLLQARFLMGDGRSPSPG
jgi:DNA-binding LacI/PurR family transcriptional regulator